MEDPTRGSGKRPLQRSSANPAASFPCHEGRGSEMVGVDSIFGAASARKLHTGRKILGERDVVFLESFQITRISLIFPLLPGFWKSY